MGRRGIRMTVPDLVAAGIALAAAIWVLIESGRWPAPEFVGGPAAIPRLVAVILILCAGLLAWKALRGQSSMIEEPLDRPKMSRLAAIAIATIVYAWGMEAVGFVPATAAYLVVFCIALGLRNWPLIGAYAVLLPSAFYTLFKVVMKVPLPSAQWPL